MTGQGRKLRLVTPDEPPRLTPGAAGMLLRILLKATAQASRPHDEQGIESCNTSHPPKNN
ncbi:hypothetical protein [Thermomonospora echinospora]|uniref:hypothetical protein n=1 Tax=Thermomonospora echinospora TaxID=1992 RepID=UPI0011B0252F|nr:hypothetical protein [Thermomonospora echinospora]